MMNRPIIVKQNEYAKALTDLTNNSGLPIEIILPVVQNLHSELERIYNENLLKAMRKEGEDGEHDSTPDEC